MIELFTAILSSPWNMVCLAPTWLVTMFIGALVAEVAMKVIFKIANRLLRTVKVVIRGWPPPHLDADGDWNTPPTTDDENGTD